MRAVLGFRCALLFSVPCVFPLSSCASSGRLREFDFRDRGLAVVTIAPPNPRVFTDDFIEAEDRGWFENLIRFGSKVARDAQAEEAGEKLARASQEVDVAGLMGDRVLERSARLLRARPLASVEGADFELEVRVKEYGIRADSWDSHADFYIQAEVLLLDSRTGDRIWREEVDARDPISSGSWAAGGPLGDLVTAQALGSLSVEEMKDALADLAIYSADRIFQELEGAWDRAHG